MGIYSTAHLAFGWNIGPVEDIDELDESLRGSGLGYLVNGGYDWDPSECQVILTVREVPSFAVDTSMGDPKDCGSHFPNVREEAVRLAVTAASALGYDVSTKQPSWWLGVSTG